jgi:hypothetical protein
MTNRTEELLRGGMERFTANVTMPQGLAVKAARHRERRRRATAAATAGTVAAAAAAAVAVIAAGTPAAPAPASAHAQTAAYVISRAETALAGINSQQVVQYLHETASGTHAAMWGLTAGTYAEWAYRGQAMFAAYGADGQLSTVTAAQLTGNQYTTTMVSYQGKKWWRQTVTDSNPAPSNGGCGIVHGSCGVPSFVTGPALIGASNWAAEIRAELSSGAYTITGTGQVDGVRALELTPATATRGLPETAFWVDSSTYLPVRDVATMGPDARVQVDFQWRQPTKANLADIGVVIPAGFTQVSPPKDFIPGH